VDFNLKGDPIYSVKFNNFLLGYVTITGILKTFYGEHTSGEAEVVSISKEKFMPMSALDIKIGVQAMKKVG
jgi:hypothetical protein